MLVRYSIFSAASGAFGGVVASRGRAGPYIRTRVRPTNPTSPAQVEVRVIFANLSIEWSNITQGQRDAWTTYATNVPATNAFGDPLILTGHQAYIRSNAPRLQAGLSRVDNGPTVFAAPLLSKVIVTPNSDPSRQLESFFPVDDPWETEVGAAYLIYCTRQNIGTVEYRRNPYRFAGAFLAFPEVPQPLSVSITAPFALTDNLSNHVFVRYFIVRADGRVSSPVHERRLIGTT